MLLAIGNCFRKCRSHLNCYELKEPLTRLRDKLSQDADCLQYFDKYASKTRCVELGVLAEIVKRVCKAMFADVHTNPLDEAEKLHWLEVLITMCQSSCANSRVEMSMSDLHPLLDVMASLLEHVASDYVVGATNTIGRPRGYISLETICKMDDDKQLSTVQHHTCLQFLQVWKSAGWGCSDVILLTEELRPLQYGHLQPQAQTAKVGANQMLRCISSYGNN